MFNTICGRFNLRSGGTRLTAAAALATTLAVGIGGIVVVRGEIPPPACSSANDHCPTVATSTCDVGQYQEDLATVSSPSV